MGLNDFLGNSLVLETVQKQLEADRLPQSVLFAGPLGVGKWTLAHFISKAVNCLNGQHDFCDQCSSCRKINQVCHPDVKHYAPEGQFIKIDQMRELSREVFFRPFEGKRRVFIIDEADKMNLESGNSILKTLEEPPETSLLILVSNKPNELLTTIRSRCQTYPFAPLHRSAVEQALSRQANHPPEDLLLLSRISEGSIGRALRINLNQYKKWREEMFDLLEVCLQNFLYSKALRLTTPLIREKDLFENKMAVLYTLLHDLFLLKIDAASESITNLDLRGKLLALCRSLSLEQLVEATKILDHLEAGAKRNLNKGLALDQFVFKLSGLLTKK